MRIPPQITRLFIVAVLLVGSYLIARSVLTPESFRRFGWYRAQALQELAEMPTTYAGKEECTTCHDDIFEVFDKGQHKTLSCEVCHGPGLAHVEDPDTARLPKPGPDQCLRCHAQNPSRPEWHVQIEPADHYEGACVECHIPHQPTESPPESEEADAEETTAGPGESS